MNIQLYKTLLETERDELVSELGSISTKDGVSGLYTTDVDADNALTEADESDIATRNEEYEEDAALTDTLAAKLKEIEDALAKIEAGTYGICEVTGEMIEEDRLMANPSARTCKAHMNN